MNNTPAHRAAGSTRQHHRERHERPIRCPFCASEDVELLSLFGSQLLTDQYYCRACHTPFEHLRADDEEAYPRVNLAGMLDRML